MKITVLFLFVGVNFIIGLSQSVIIANQESRTLYRNYENRIVTSFPNNEQIELQVIGGKVTPILWNDENNSQQKGFSVIVDSNSREVKMTLVSLDTLNQLKNFDTLTFKVFPFPIPEIQGSIISKSVDFKVVLGLSASSEIQGAPFLVLGDKIKYKKKEFKFEGNLISSELIRNIKQGTIASIEVEYEVIGRGFGCFKTSKDIKIGF
jgi:hypothetical protein